MLARARARRARARDLATRACVVRFGDDIVCVCVQAACKLRELVELRAAEAQVDAPTELLRACARFLCP